MRPTKKLRLRRPSPTAIVGIIALVIALSGTAIAGGVLTTKKFKNQSLRGPVQYVSSSVTVPSNAAFPPTKVLAACPTGTKPVGGGIKVDTVVNVNSYAADGYITAAGYAGTVYNGSGATRVFTVTAACVTVKTTAGTPPAS